MEQNLVMDYKCPSCGSNMVFDTKTGMLVCGSCGRKEPIESLPDPLQGVKGTPAAGGLGRAPSGSVPGKKVPHHQEAGANGDSAAREYHCNSCGAIIMTEPETSATTCTYCGSAVVLADRLSGELAPAKVIPFAISKEEAVAAFRKWCRNGRLTPTGFMTGDRVKSLTGMYVPFWLYDLDNKVEVHANGTKVRSYVRGDYRITETQHYDIYRDMKLSYVKVPVDASVMMKDDLMDKLEPFPYNQLKPFKTPYLAGYMAEKYGLDHNDLRPRAEDKIRRYIQESIQSTMAGYTTVQYRSTNIHTRVEQADYVLLPVWTIHYDYKGQHYIFAMNGQTGKVVGKPPLSRGKIVGWFAGIAGASFIGLKLLALGMGGPLW